MIGKFLIPVFLFWSIGSSGLCPISENDGWTMPPLPTNCPENARTRVQPPTDAIVLFQENQSINEMTKKFGKENSANIVDGYLVPPAASRQTFTDFFLHLEFNMLFGGDNYCSNSGTEFQNLEIQIQPSNSGNLKPSSTGGIYSYLPPDTSVAYEAGCWESFDINYQIARFDEDGNKIKNAIVSVYYNGVLIHDQVEIVSENLGKNAGNKEEDGLPGPITFQGTNGIHMRIRNLWIIPNSEHTVSLKSEQSKRGSTSPQGEFSQVFNLLGNFLINGKR